MSCLHHESLSTSANPKQWMLLLHGFLGSGANMRSFARKLMSDLADWGFLLVDLRLHGASQTCDGPHTLEAVANDVIELVKELNLDVKAICGHSFGAKVVLQILRSDELAIDHAFVLDSVPWVASIERLKSSLPKKLLAILKPFEHQVFSSRAEFVDALMAQNLSRPTSLWLAMNLEHRADGHYVLRLQIDAMSALLDDFYAQDFVTWLQALKTKPKHCQIQAMLGAESKHLDDSDRARLATLIPVSIIARAGHDVHIDNPDEIRALIMSALLGEK